jgi:hypothetical protein
VSSDNSSYCCFSQVDPDNLIATTKEGKKNITYYYIITIATSLMFMRTQRGWRIYSTAGNGRFEAKIFNLRLRTGDENNPKYNVKSCPIISEPLLFELFRSDQRVEFSFAYDWHKWNL